MNWRSNVVLALTLAAGSAHSVDFFKPSQAEQIKLGQKASQEIRKDPKIKVVSATDSKVIFLRAVAKKVIDAIGPEKANWPYTFDIIESKDLNAFALPGGPVFVYTGLLDKLTTEDQLAAILGHELTHVRKEHWARAYADRQKRDVLLTLGLILGKANRSTADIVSIGSEILINLPYSRKQETEADDVGFEVMVKAGYNPQGMADTFEILSKASKGGKFPEWMSDHPEDKGRIKRVTDRIAKSQQTYPAQKPAPWAKKPESSPGSK